MPQNEFIYFKCIEVRQPIGTFYVGALSHSQVVAIAYADVRRIQERDIERYIGIQRPLEDKRVKELRKYVRTIDSSFPTSVILALNSADAEFDPESGIMRVRNGFEIAKIIDGQHRIAGLLNYEGPPFQINVTLFVDMDIEDQALLFATINLKQTKVNKSLAYDLYEFAETRSPQKTCHNIARLLNTKEGSPLYKRIKILGVATGEKLEYLTQASVVERLMKYVSADPMADRDLILRREKLRRALKFEETEKKLIFRNLFIDDRDDDIAVVVWNFLTAVAKRWPIAWNTSEPGYVLNRGTGFVALMRALPEVYLGMERLGQVPTVEDFAEYVGRVPLEDAQFTKEFFLPGGGGETRLFNALIEGMHIGRRVGASLP